MNISQRQLYVKEVLLGGVDAVVELAGKGDLKTQLARSAGVSGHRTGSAGAAVKSVQDRCKELVGR